MPGNEHLSWMKIGICLFGLALILCLGMGESRGQEDLFAQGQEVFINICAQCHRENGEGLPGTFPALNQNPFVLGDPGPVILTVLNGRKGKLGQMPTWKDKLSDRQIAAAITYIRGAWTNRAPAVLPAMVAALRGR
jgi:cytochrome c6